MERAHTFDATLSEEQRHPGAGSFVRSSAVKDDVAIAGDEVMFLFDLFRREA